jgi:hypothetical protein
MPTVPSQQPNVSNQYLEPHFMPPAEIPLYSLNGSFYNEGHPSFSNPTVSTSHESSSQFLPEDTQADRYTEYTAASDQFSTVFECGWAIPSMGSSMNSSQLQQQQLVPPSAPQQPADNTDYNLESGLSGTNQGPDLTHSLLDSRRGSGRHSSWQDLEQGNPPPEWL